MDQGALVQALIEQQVVRAALEQEELLDQELHKYENMTEDDYEEIRRKRLEAMKKTAKQNSDWRARGHGEYREIPEEKQFFQEIKKTDRVVCHFYRDNWACKAIDHHLEVLCKQHLETKFLRINAEKSPFLTEKLKIWMLPTIALIKQEKTIGYIVGLDELGGNESFPTEWLAARLAQDKMIKWEAGDAYTTTAAPEAAVNIRKGGQARGGVERGSSDEDSDFDE